MRSFNSSVGTDPARTTLLFVTVAVMRSEARLGSSAILFLISACIAESLSRSAPVTGVGVGVAGERAGVAEGLACCDAGGVG